MAQQAAAGASRTAKGFESKIAASNAEAKKATAQARTAEALAKQYESQIADSNARVKEAEARAAEARSMAEADHLARVKVEEELEKLRLPRSLVDIPGLISVLQPYAGTEYTFSSVFQAPEAIDLLKLIDSVLLRSGWTRTKPPGGFPAINVYGADQEFAVPAGFNMGLQISVDDSLPLDVLKSTPIAQLPPLVRAAVALDTNVFSHTFPKEETAPANVQRGTSSVIRIAVGQKP